MPTWLGLLLIVLGLLLIVLGVLLLVLGVLLLANARLVAELLVWATH